MSEKAEVTFKDTRGHWKITIWQITTVLALAETMSESYPFRDKHLFVYTFWGKSLQMVLETEQRHRCTQDFTEGTGRGGFPKGGWGRWSGDGSPSASRVL